LLLLLLLLLLGLTRGAAWWPGTAACWGDPTRYAGGDGQVLLVLGHVALGRLWGLCCALRPPALGTHCWRRLCNQQGNTLYISTP
jgi:hypothetical protein